MKPEHRPSVPTRAVCALLGLTLTGWAAAQEPAEAAWRGRVLPLADLEAAAELDREATSAVERWWAFAQPRGYRLVLSAEGRVLLVLSPSRKRRSRSSEVGVVRRFVEAVDRTVGEVRRLMPEVRQRTVAVVGVRSEDYGDLLRVVAEQEKSLSEWASTAAGTRCGFSLGRPLVGAWIEDPDGVDEWSEPHEVVHRVAAGMFLGHAPELPPWLVTGLAWHVEDRVQGSIYCFPFRAGFVSILDHTDWHRALARRYGKRGGAGFHWDHVAAWNPRQGFEEEPAHVAFGVARFLADEVPFCVAGLLTELRDETRERRRVRTGEFSWEIDDDYVLPVEVLGKVFDRHTGGGVEDALSEFFRRGKSKPPKERRAP